MKTSSISYKTAQVNGLKLFYREAGDPQAFAVLLLHGFFPPQATCSATSSGMNSRKFWSTGSPNHGQPVK
jgi:hypothetical protein